MKRAKLGIVLLSAILVIGALATAPAGASTARGGADLWVSLFDPNSYDLAYSVAASPDGSKVFVTGSTFRGASSDDYATIAYDSSSGATLWVRPYNGPGNGSDYASSLAVSPDSSRVFVTGFSHGGTGSDDYTTIAYDAASGEALWIGRYNGPGNSTDAPTSIGTSPDGSMVFVTGYSWGQSSSEDFVTIAYDASTGTVRWMRRFDGPGNGRDVAYAVVASPNGSMVFVTGSSQGETSSADYVTMAYDASTGALLWVRRYNGPGNDADEALSVSARPGGSIVFVTGDSIGATSAFDYATIAYDASTGATLWLRRFNGPGNSFDVASSVSASGDGSKVLVTGYSGGVTSSDDYATIAYDASTGGKLWVRRYNGSGNAGDYADSITASPDGSKAFVTGSSYGPNGWTDYATVAYDTLTGALLWVRRYNGPGDRSDFADSIAASPDGSKVFVTGGADGGPMHSLDYTTIAYDA